MKLQNIIIIILVVVIILLFTCNGGTKTEYKTIEVVRVDSVRTTDTVERILSVPVASVPIIDTIYLSDTIKRYHYGKSDSLLTYNIFIDSKCRPKKVDFKYDIKQFTIKDSIYIRDSVHTFQKPKSYVSLGINMFGNPSYFGVAPTINYAHKKGNTYTIGYDPINKLTMVGFSKKLSFRKK